MKIIRTTGQHSVLGEDSGLRMTEGSSSDSQGEKTKKCPQINCCARPLLLVGLLLCSFATHAFSQNVVSDWNMIAVQTITLNAGKPPTTSSIYLAIMHLAVYDAVESIDKRFSTYASSPYAPPGASKEAAVIAAAHRTLVSMFPTQQVALDAAYSASLANIPDSQSKVDGIAVGEATAQAILELRANDGRDPNGVYAPGHGPGIWEPTPPGFLPALTPWVARTLPFTMSSPSQFLPEEGPPALDSREWADDYNRTKLYGAKTNSLRTPEQTEIGLFWTENPTIQTHRAYRALAIRQNLGTEDSARFFAMVSVAQADALIGCWNAKYHFNFWRPVTAIRAGDSDGNTGTAPDSSWESLAITPNHPEFPAAHGCNTEAATRTLAGFFGTDKVSISFDSTVTGTTHVFSRFSDVIKEVGEARIYGGMHYHNSVVQGELLGRKVAHQLLRNYFRPVEGGAERPEDNE